MKKRIVYPVLIVLTLAFIWGNSCLPSAASNAVSGGFMAWLTKLFPFLKIGMYLLRKIGHYLEFTWLGLLLCRTYQVYGLPVSAAALTGVLAAMTDETIQLFVPGRSSQVTDVWIDFLGISTGIVLLILAQILWMNFVERKQKK